MRNIHNAFSTALRPFAPLPCPSETIGDPIHPSDPRCDFEPQAEEEERIFSEYCDTPDFVREAMGEMTDTEARAWLQARHKGDDTEAGRIMIEVYDRCASIVTGSEV